MEVYRTLPAAAERRPCALTIGNFDGVHLGHQAMLSRLGELAAAADTARAGDANATNATASARRLSRCVLTFDPHPRDFFAASRGLPCVPRISTEQDKLAALAEHGIDRVCILNFDAEMANMSAEAFVRDIIAGSLMAKTLLIGDDFRFGAKRQGDFALLSSLAGQYGYQLHRTPTVTIDDQRVSSSRVRHALAGGAFDELETLLGRRYSISGQVIRGRQLGRKLGFPTINLALPFPQPALSGIFVVRVFGVNSDLEGTGLPAVASLGTRPSVENNGRFLLEVHLLDFNGDLYDQTVRVEFLDKLRDEAHYETLDLLKQQIASDTDQARAWFEARQESNVQSQ